MSERIAVCQWEDPSHEEVQFYSDLAVLFGLPYYNPMHVPAIIMDVTIRPLGIAIWSPKDSGMDDEWWRIVYKWLYIPEPSLWTGKRRGQ